jgi:ABC-type transport system involved in multi-copper enzyme maturation permease subunit
VAVGTAALAFLIGATYIGAEWSSRSMVALLFWVPRRTRVLVTKTAVLAAAALVLGVLGQVVWFLTAQVLARTRGNTEVPKDFWSPQLAQHGRGVLLVVILGLLGFALANLFRHTAAAMGFGFVYFVIIENLVRGLRPAWQPWLLTDNAAALVSRGGYRIYSNSGYVDEQGNYIDSGKEIVLSNLHGGLVLGGAVAVLLALGTVLFVRRDLH